MLARDETPGVKRRLRTGCLACRKRRRKCDEHKPSCENCVKRGAQCQYPGFTSVSIPAAAKSGYSSGNSSLFRATNDDLGTGAAVQADDPSETGQVLADALVNGLASPTQQWQQSHSDPTTLSTNDQSHINLRPSQATPVERYYQGVHLPLESTTLSTFQFGTENTVSTTSSLSFDLHHVLHKPSLLAPRSQVDPERASIPNDVFPPDSLQTTNPTSLAGSISSTTARETALLCHFRYNLAPWLDINDCGAFFGVKLFLLARETRAVMAAILSIAARHLHLKNKSNVRGADLECCLSYRQEAESAVFHETASIQQLVKILLVLETFLRSNPQQWKDVVRQVASPSDSVAFEVVEEPLRWVCFRIGMLPCTQASY
ncbi:hypothetical protein LTR84_010356 [Exophiala bonariae]|uniref:Zn(2)-C6 fungal-type domain-containing protein n=1 Tax=Exophiala bonariae TaxID=1690606 RepID=A0AAV9MTY2_9EURO|nr:hypothetical protein LTR84_010356 [Exophiala bonariae]